MILLKDIKGQDNAIRYLRSVAKRGVLGSYLFTGPQGVGKALTARAFLASLVCGSGKHEEPCGECIECRRVEKSMHPDINWISSEKNKAISVERIRLAREILAKKPFGSSINVLVIENAHLLTEEASNALLKVIEEPPAQGSCIILITDKRELLLPTIISRCSEVRFFRLSPLDTERIIIQKKPDIEKTRAAFLAYFSQGSPARALEIEKEGIEERKKKIVSFLNGLADEDAVFPAWDTEDKDQILEDMETLLAIFRDISVASKASCDLMMDSGIKKEGMYDYFSKFSARRINDIAEKIIELKMALSGNANPKIIAQILPIKLKEA